MTTNIGYHARRESVKAQPETATSVSQNQKLGQVCVFRLQDIRPSPENDKLYNPVDPSDPEVKALAASIRARGILEPLLLTSDRYIISGHRRYAAAKLAGLYEVPCRVENITCEDPAFMTMLRECNRQREKTDAERLRETLVDVDPEEAYRAIAAYRQQQSQVVDMPSVPLEGVKVRFSISKAKWPFLWACQKVIQDLRPYWPVSVRQVHYGLLNNPPRIHALKPDSVYQNKPTSYKALCELLVRARLSYQVPMFAIADETRPVATWDVHQNTTPFFRREFDRLFKGYYRNLQQAQPNHLEIVGEKNTLLGILRPVALEYRIPLTIARGYCSLPPKYEIAERFRRSGKETLILLVLSDFDPDGEEICHSLARSLRDDFDVSNIHPVKVSLTHEQVQSLALVPSMEAKTGSSQYAKFIKRYGKDVFELEAVPPDTLQGFLRDAIDSVLDVPAFNAEIDAEKQDAANLEKTRRIVHRALQETGLNLEEDEVAVEGADDGASE